MDDNSLEAVAVRRAFFTSINSTEATRSTETNSKESWTYERILEWIDGTLDSAMKVSDMTNAAKMVWREWAEAEQHIPDQVRKGIVTRLDAKLSGHGFPSLRELLENI